MTQEDEKILIKDICARVPYGLYVDLPYNQEYKGRFFIYIVAVINKWVEGILFYKDTVVNYSTSFRNVKPYLRSMSKMTKKEREEYEEVKGTPEAMDYLLSHYFDYRHLIEKNLAIEAPEDMYTFGNLDNMIEIINAICRWD